MVHGLNISKKGVRVFLTWKKEDPRDVARAKRFFVKLTRQGWIAAKYNGELTRVLEFMPEYEELLFMPLIEGG